VVRFHLVRGISNCEGELLMYGGDLKVGMQGRKAKLVREVMMRNPSKKWRGSASDCVRDCARPIPVRETSAESWCGEGEETSGCIGPEG
jgi:hypothetical protein